jgi:hypothetical protein
MEAKMWTVASLINGAWSAVPFSELAQPPRSDTGRGIAANTLPEGQQHLLKHLDAEM